MKNIFTKEAWDQMKTQGYYKPGIILSPNTVSALRNQIDNPPPEGSIWTNFLFSADSKAGVVRYENAPPDGTYSRCIRSAKLKFARTFRGRTDRNFCKYNYRQSILGSSKLLPKILDELLEKGFANHLSDNALLVAHDIYLENTDLQFGFGFHEDGWSLELLYNTGDDVSIYISLQNHDENTGGRLHIDPNFASSERFKHRNRAIKEFSKFCQDIGCVDENGYATREKILKSKKAMKEFRRLRDQRATLPVPDKESLRGVSSAPGEVILFPNLFFHSGEHWKPGNEGSKGLYFIAFMPLYDLKIRPPSTFLEGEPCSRYVIDPAKEQAIHLAPDINPIPIFATPLPEQ